MTQPTISAERIEEMLTGLESRVVPYSARPELMREVLTLALSALRTQAQPQGVRDALEFYRGEAEAAAKDVPAKQTGSMAAILTVMSLDGGRRAREALSALATPPAPVDGWGDPQEIERVEAEVKTLLADPVDGLVDGGPWRTMDTAPLDGKHCILAVPEPDGVFIYNVQGAYSGGEWNCVHRGNVKPLYWMPNFRLPKGWEALATTPAPVDGGVTDAQYDLTSAAKFLLWQFDRQGPLTESTEAWEQLRAALATPPAPVDGGVTDAQVEAAARAMWKASVPPTQENGFPDHPCIARTLYMKSAYAALTASRAAVAQDETP